MYMAFYYETIFTQRVWLTLHLQATHVILVIGVNEFTIFISIYAS